jgi:excisionase family DNA binding protein
MKSDAQSSSSLSNLLSVQDAAKILGVSPWTVRSWLSQRKLSFIKVGRLTRLSPAVLQQFINRNTVQARGGL